jgi:hypothetical protein
METDAELDTKAMELYVFWSVSGAPSWDQLIESDKNNYRTRAKQNENKSTYRPGQILDLDCHFCKGKRPFIVTGVFDESVSTAEIAAYDGNKHHFHRIDF